MARAWARNPGRLNIKMRGIPVGSPKFGRIIANLHNRDVGQKEHVPD